MDDQHTVSVLNRPTMGRPLLGLTVLVVEDSRFACEALRLLCIRSGARIRRADSLKSAQRHLQVYRPTVAIIDQGLPDGSGASLIADLSQVSPRVPVILGTSGDDFAESIAIAAGADGFLTKPVQSVAAFQRIILDHLPDAMRPSGLRVVSGDTVHPDETAYFDDMAHAAELIAPDSGTDGGTNTQDYLAQFLSSVAHSAGDAALALAADALADARQSGASVNSAMTRLSALVQARLAQRLAI